MTMNRRILVLALPIIMANISQSTMSLIDIAMVGRLGAAAVGAVGLAGMLTFVVASFLTSIEAGVQTIVARRVGADRFDDVAETVRTTAPFSLIVGSVIGFVFVAASGWLFPYLNADPVVRELGIAYIGYRGYSLGFVMAGFVLFAFYNGISRPNVHLGVTVITNVVNVVLDYGLIYGRLGLPEMGAAGAGLATALASVLAFLLYFGFTFAPAIHRLYPHLWRGQRSVETLVKVLRLSLPAAFQQLGVMFGFTSFMVMMGWVSTIALAATQIVFNILSFSFMPAMGFLFAAQTMVSEYMGAGNLDDATRVPRKTVVLCIVFMGTMGLLFVTLPGAILRLFTPEIEIITMGVWPLRILGFAQFFDAVGMVYYGALRGAGDNVFTAVADVALMWLLFLPLVWLLSMFFNMGIVGGWIALAVYLAAFAGLVFTRFQRGHWKTIVV